MKEAKPLTEGYIPSGKKGDYNYYGGFNDGIKEGAKQEQERILKLMDDISDAHNSCWAFNELRKELKKEISK